MNAATVAEQFGAEYELTKRKGIVLNMDNDSARRTVEQCYRTHKTLVNPIIDWSDDEVWEFIHTNNIPYCKLYDEGWTRLGCIGCPLAEPINMKKQFKRWPGMERMYLSAFDEMLKLRKAAGRPTTWETAEDVMDWWTQDLIDYPLIEDQIKIGDDNATE